jgi:hypothetical protein
MEVIKAESQVVLNTLTEHNFQHGFKKWQKCWEWCMHTGGNYFEGHNGQQDLKLISDPMAAPVLEMDDSLYITLS